MNGACVCPAGYVACANACVASSVDAANCGACGHTCGSAQVCVQGTCVLESSLYLATGLAGPADLATDTQNVYWSDTTDNSIRAVSKNGGPVTTLASGQANPSRIALDASYVYWSNNSGNTIFRAPKNASASPALVTDASTPGPLVVAGSTLYFESGWSYSSPDGPVGGTGMMVAVGGGMAIPQACSGTELITDGTNMWCGGAGGPGNTYVMGVDIATGTQVAESSGYEAGGLVIGLGSSPAAPGTNVLYLWTTDELDQYSYFNWDILPTLQSGGSVPLNYNNPSHPPPLVSDIVGSSCAAFFIYGGTIVMYVPAVNSTLTGIMGGAKRVVFDSGYLYWTDSSGAIGKMLAPQ